MRRRGFLRNLLGAVAAAYTAATAPSLFKPTDSTTGFIVLRGNGDLETIRGRVFGFTVMLDDSIPPDTIYLLDSKSIPDYVSKDISPKLTVFDGFRSTAKDNKAAEHFKDKDAR